MSADVAQIVKELAEGGSAGFRASWIARQVDAEVDDVRNELMGMVHDGALQLKYQLLCPDNGRTIRSYSNEDELPLGEEVSDERCDTDEPFLVEKSNIWVTFEQTADLLRHTNRELSRQLKKNFQVIQRRDCPKVNRTRWILMRNLAL